MALATTSNWTFGFIIGMVSPGAFSGVHFFSYPVIAESSLRSAIRIHFYHVETTHYPLEDIAVAFCNKVLAGSDAEAIEIADVTSEQVESSV